MRFLLSLANNSSTLLKNIVSITCDRPCLDMLFYLPNGTKEKEQMINQKETKILLIKVQKRANGGRNEERSINYQHVPISQHSNPLVEQPYSDLSSCISKNWQMLRQKSNNYLRSKSIKVRHFDLKTGEKTRTTTEEIGRQQDNTTIYTQQLTYAV